MGTLGRNRVFPIYVDVNGVKTSFHGLALKKSVVESSLMSLGDKISGDVYYMDNRLDVSMHEYIEYKRNPDDPDEDPVKYVLVNPPTIVREGLTQDNSELKGLTKYSFVFYHPMYQLNNLPFTDVAVQNTDVRYKSEDKHFSWIGNLEDFVAKINKNLENTLWVVELSTSVPQGVVDKLSDVLNFDSSTIADALKQAYETWEVPFVIDSIKRGEPYYALGRRFQILIGLPYNEIYASERDRQLGRPFVFWWGRGVGLKNNSRTPRNNKIITRIAGSGSSDNIPYGYPQIVWYGNQDWEYTINNDPSNYFSYPIYEGIVGGQWVKLIKHPFTRTQLMPSVYSEAVFNKVSPYLANGEANPNYNPNLELVDYYDADDPNVYPNTIVQNAPSYEIHQFEDIKPELGQEYIIDAWPINNDMSDADHWDDTMDNDGNYTQSYFKVKLPVLSFDLYACAAITQEMQINMRSGACIGCTFPVQVDWDEYKANFYDDDGNFAPDGEQRDTSIFPKSNVEQITIILQKEYATFGVIMPNVYQKPKGESSVGAGDGDQFVILGISLPLSYIANAEHRLDESMKSYMLENNIHYFDYPLKFDEKFLYDNTYILEQIRNNTIIRFNFAYIDMSLYVKQISIKYGESVLPQYDITLTDDVSVVLNQIGQAQKDIDKINTLIYSLQQNYNRNVWTEIARKLSKVNDDTAQGKITFNRGFHSNQSGTFGNWTPDASGAGIWMDGQHDWHIEGDFLHARKKLVAKEVQIEEVSHIGGAQLLTAASMKCDFVVDKGDYWRCFFLKNGADGTIITNKWKIGDQAYVNTFNLERQENKPNGDLGDYSNHYLWRLVVGIDDATHIDDGEYEVGGETVNGTDYHYIDLSKGICGVGSDDPKANDDIVQLGYQGEDGEDRQNAIIIAGAGTYSPYIRQFTGINTFHWPSPETQIKPNANLFSGVVKMQNGSLLPNGKDVYTTIETLESKQEELGEDLANLTTGNENLLLNTGFTGDYESADVDAVTIVDDDTPIYSPELKFWDVENAEVGRCMESTTGLCAILNEGEISQPTTQPMQAGEKYCISFKAKGSHVYVTIGGYSEMVILNDDVNVVRKTLKFTCSELNDVFTMQGTCWLMDIQLTMGEVPNRDWLPSPLDNDKAIAKFQDIEYLSHAINNGSTTVLGGLILSEMIRVGKYRNGEMEPNGETGGMSGLWVSDQSPFLWGGGDMEQAFYTINKYASDPSYQATEEEVARMAKFVVTHGGRAILNDIVLRGYIYALGGYFKGNLECGTSDKFMVDAKNGIMRMNGYSGADEETLKPNPSTARIDFLKLFYEYDPDTFARCVTLMLDSSNNYDIKLNVLDGLRHTHHWGSGLGDDYTELSNTNGFVQESYNGNKVQLTQGLLQMIDKTRHARFEFDGSSINWYHTETGAKLMGGVLDIDENGYVKVLLDND